MYVLAVVFPVSGRGCPLPETFLALFVADSLCVKPYSTLSYSVLELIKDVEKLSRGLQNLHIAKPLFIRSSTTSLYSTIWEKGQCWIRGVAWAELLHQGVCGNLKC